MSERLRLVVVGQISGAFGVKGEVRVRSFTDDPDACFAYGPLLDEKGAVILTPLKARPLNQDYGVVTKEQRQREEWEALKGALLHVPRAAMPATGSNEFYVADLIGMEVVHADGRMLGKVKAVQNFGAGELIEIAPTSGAAFLLPFSDAVFPDVDMNTRRLTASPAEELLPEPLQRQSSDGGTN